MKVGRRLYSQTIMRCHINHFVVAVFAIAGFASAPALAGISYFLVAERPGQAVHHDSFVVPISDAGQIAHARDLIARGPENAGGSILFATIAAGSGDGVNRDLLSPDLHEWNWHVTNVSGFNDMGIEILDGWPTYVHEHRDTWLNQTGGNIGFWNYTVVKEIPNYDPQHPRATPVPLPPAAMAGGITLVAMAAGFAFFQRRARMAAEE
jgi:hypothetical protein